MRDERLTRGSLLSLILVTVHVADDIRRGLSPANAGNLVGIVIFVAWLYGTLVLADRRSGHVIMLLGGLFAAAMPVLHMTGRGYATIAGSAGGLLFVWTLLASGVLGLFTSILAARGLVRMRQQGAP
ncbi:MAG TPA: hypothetical protein VFV33_00420 [Gemmatimonadaceae bacterium]|nr:hypothetical protein [Gemmatimonadaceae bacterium]